MWLSVNQLSINVDKAYHMVFVYCDINSYIDITLKITQLLEYKLC